MSFQSKNKQSGVALITAVLIVSLAVVASISIAENYELNFRRTITAFDSGQAWSYAKGAEQWAKAILARDQKDNTYDAYDTDNAWWNNGAPLVFPLPDGFIEGSLEDAQGKLNINSLLEGNKPNPIAQLRFERLFTTLEINKGLVGAIIDWIDANPNPTGSDGAEFDIYIGLETPYLPADQPMKDISELRLVHGIDQEIYNKLIPHVTVLSDANSPLNINTASAEVLETLAPNIRPGLGQELVAEREDKPYKQVGDLQRHPLIQQNGITLDTDRLGIKSDHFLLNTKCVIGKSQVKMVSLIHRGAGNNLQIIKRSQKL